MKKYISYALFFSLLVLLLTACGSGGGDVAPSATYTKRTFKINLNANGVDLGEKAINSVYFTFTLPDNVTPVATGIILNSGIFTDADQSKKVSPDVTYTPASATSKGTLKVLLTSSAVPGVKSTGEIATVSLQQLDNGAAAIVSSAFNTVPAIVTYSEGSRQGDQLDGMTVSIADVTLP
jgi:hypothetical protein